MTLLLVEGFSGYAGQDLDTNDDGIFDSTPWTRIVDDVAVTDGGVADRLYSSTVLVAGYDGNINMYGGASRIPNGADSDDIGDWMRNDYEGAGLPGFTGLCESGEAVNSPEAVNQTCDAVAVEPATWGRIKSMYRD